LKKSDSYEAFTSLKLLFGDVMISIGQLNLPMVLQSSY